MEISQGTRYPVHSHCFYGSLKSRRWTGGVPRDGHAMTAKRPARRPATFLAQCLRAIPQDESRYIWQAILRNASLG
jgi:hypothetical protein